MKEIFHDTTGVIYICIALALRLVYDWEKTSWGQKLRQLIIGSLLAFLVSKVYLDIYASDPEMMKYIGAAVFSCAFLGELALDVILKKALAFMKTKNPVK